jgi:hypothetical protein
MIYQAAFERKVGVPYMSFKAFKNTRKLEKEYKQSVQFT